LVPAGSTVQRIDEINAPGKHIVAIANTTTMRAARRACPDASLREVPSVDEMLALARAGEGDAFALSKDAFATILPKLPGARVLPGNYQQTGIAVAVPPGRPRALAAVTALLGEAKRSGAVRRALDAAGFRDTPVAP
jgi:polar amino acid transport system substrate-binding protein